MRSLLAVLLLTLSLAACSSDSGESTTVSDPIVEPAPPPSTMSGSGVYTPAPEAYRRLCDETPEACE